MARGTKNAFSFFGRKASFTEDVGSHRDEPLRKLSTNSSINGAHLSKAERLLGSSSLPVQTSSSSISTKKYNLATRPSIASLTLSEASAEDLDYDLSAQNSVANHDRSMFPPRNESLQQNIVGNTFKSNNDYEIDQISISTRDLRQEHSEDVLSSYYDPSRYPLGISQQTSESAIRDRALRKGLQPVIPDQPKDSPTDRVAPNQSQDWRRPSLAPETVRQRKTSRLNMNRLFPRPKTSGSNARDMHRSTHSPSQVSLSSEFQVHEAPSLPHLRTGTDFRDLYSPSKERFNGIPWPTSRAPQPHGSSLHAMYENPKINIKRPQRRRENWFDGLSDDDDEEDEVNEVDEVEEDLEDLRVLPDLTKHQPATHRDTVSRPASTREWRATSPSSSNYSGSGRQTLMLNPLDATTPTVSSHPPEAIQSTRPLSHYRKSTQSLAYHDRPASRSSTHSRMTGTFDRAYASSSRPSIRSDSVNRKREHSLRSHVTSASLRSRKSRSSWLAEVDLKKSSALSLNSTSSLDEREYESDNTFAAARDSIAVSDYGSDADDVQIVEAQAFAVRSMPARQVRSGSYTREGHLIQSVRKLSGSEEEKDIVAEIRPRRDTDVTQASKASKGDNFSAPSSPYDLLPAAAEQDGELSTADADGSQFSGGPRRNSMNVKRLSLRSSHERGGSLTIKTQRFMAVSPEEEALLEMMRNKRAEMANATSQIPTDHTESLLADDTARDTLEAFLSSDSDQQLTGLPATSADEERIDEASVSGESSLTNIMEAFPSPSPTTNRFSVAPMNVGVSAETNKSPALSMAGSSVRIDLANGGRYSTLSVGAGSNFQSTPGTSAPSVPPTPMTSKPEVIPRSEKAPSGETMVHTLERSLSQMQFHKGVASLSLDQTEISDVRFPHSSSSSYTTNTAAFPPARGSLSLSPEGMLWLSGLRQKEETAGRVDKDAISHEHGEIDSRDALETKIAAHSLTDKPEPPRTGRSTLTFRQSHPSFRTGMLEQGPSEEEKLWAKRRRSMRINVSNTPPSAVPLDPAPTAPAPRTASPLAEETQKDMLEAPASPSIRSASPLSFDAINLYSPATPSFEPKSQRPAAVPNIGAKAAKRPGVEYRLTPRVYSTNTATLDLRPTSPSFPDDQFTQLANSSRTISSPHRVQPAAAGQHFAAFAAPAPVLGRSSSHAFAYDSSAPQTLRTRSARVSRPKAINIANVKRVFSSHKETSPVMAPLHSTESSPRKLSKSRRLSLLSMRSSTTTSTSASASASVSATASAGPIEQAPRVDTPSSIDTGRCSVSEDVLAAWGSLGGWRGIDSITAN